ncbi:MAG: 1-acyl-sn-glycerol-3-phosphate acyltransferase [Bacteroidia bacterium]|nr:1-acyl-sn-glycerol-3-phosphate acyltransferase [Bacteroidia bacterium]
MKVLYKIYFAFYFALTLLLFYPFFKILLSRKKWFPAAFKLMRLYAKLWLFFTGIKLVVKGKDNFINNEPHIICANHSSFIDIPCLYSFFSRYFVFTGKQEIEKWPLFHIFYTSGMNILVDRNNVQRASLSLKKMITVLNEGHPLFIFPEGTISGNAPLPGVFKPGATALAIQKQVPILPITFTTNWERLQRTGLFKGKAGPGIAEMIIHEPIHTKGLKKSDTEALDVKLKETIFNPIHEKYNFSKKLTT